MANRSPVVNQFMKDLDHPRKDEIEQIRTIILDANPQITEHIKWNAPSFCYNGDDRVTLRLQPKNMVQLVFHRGAQKRDDSQSFVFEDSTGLLEWVTPDRATVTFQDRKDVDAKEAALAELVSQWMQSTTD